MGELKSFYEPVATACPHCHEVNEMNDLEVSVTVEGYDDGRFNQDGVHVIECVCCQKKYVLTAQLDIVVHSNYPVEAAA